MKALEEEQEARWKRFRAIHVQAEEERYPLRRFQSTTAWRMLTEEMSVDGQRYAKSAIIVGTMVKCGLSLSEALRLFDRYATYGESFTRESVERMYRQFS
jgi:hypothetical protein